MSATWYDDPDEEEESVQPKRAPRWLVVSITVVVFFLGLMIGIAAGGAGDDEIVGTDAAAEIEQLRAERDMLQAALDEQGEAPADPEPAPEPEPEPGPATSFGGGTHVVGTDIQPGVYRTDSDAGGLCYWARLSGLSGGINDVIANGIPDGPTTIEIAESDAAFETSGCNWEKVQ